MSSSSSSCLILLYSILTIASASLQAVAFKNAGYALGPYPYFILLAVSFAFVPIFFIGVALIQKYGQILKAAQSGQEAFKEVQGAIREIKLQLQVGQNGTSQLLVELDTLRGRHAASAALQVAQFFLFIGYLLTLSIIYVVRKCKKHRERLAEEEVELIEQKLQERKARRRAAAAKAKAVPGPNQE